MITHSSGAACLAQAAPFFKYAVYIVRIGSGTEFTLSDTSAVLPQGVVHILYRIVNIGQRTSRVVS